MSLITQKEYARRRRVSPQYVSKLVRAGKLPLVHGRVDPAKADKALAAWRQASRGSKLAKNAGRGGRKHAKPAAAHERHPASTTATGKLTAARAKREEYLAEQARLEYEKTVGTLLVRDEVQAAERLKNERLRTRLRRLPRNLAPVLERAESAAKIEQLLLEEIDGILAELATDIFGQSDASSEVQTSAEAEEARVADGGVR